ncbi:hypothetical protein D3C86_1967170 [compost metagenome]
MLLELRELPIEEFDGFLSFGSLALDVLANVLGADFIERIPETITIAIFERYADHVGLLTLFPQLEAFLEILGCAEQRCTRDLELGPRLAIEP